ncbi:uncharacterized protein LOC134751280 [Cydia strobilella]|uniref:uncharacterized protein LOC134751280 n=1 Tax=Cydia strobilella TaxID=1100964 RepID=UPI003006BE9B
MTVARGDGSPERLGGALRRLHYKATRRAHSVGRHHTNTPPKVVVMGSSTTSDKTINTSTDSAATALTSVTGTDDSMDAEPEGAANLIDCAPIQPIPQEPPSTAPPHYHRAQDSSEIDSPSYTKPQSATDILDSPRPGPARFVFDVPLPEPKKEERKPRSEKRNKTTVQETAPSTSIQIPYDSKMEMPKSPKINQTKYETHFKFEPEKRRASEKFELDKRRGSEKFEPEKRRGSEARKQKDKEYYKDDVAKLRRQLEGTEVFTRARRRSSAHQHSVPPPCSRRQSTAAQVHVTANPLDAASSMPPGRTTIVVQQPSLSLDYGGCATILVREGDDCRRKSRVCSDHIQQLLDVTSHFTSEDVDEFDKRYGSPHHARSQSVKAARSRTGERQLLGLPQQRARVASMPNTGVEEEYYRLRHFSITAAADTTDGTNTTTTTTTWCCQCWLSTIKAGGGGVGGSGCIIIMSMTSFTISVSGNEPVLNVDFQPALELDIDGFYECALVYFKTFNTIPNVDKSNNLFHYGDDIIAIPEGSYELSSIIHLLKEEMSKRTKGSEGEGMVAVADILSQILVEGTVEKGCLLVNNGAAFLFQDIRYELNGVEIDQARNCGITSTMKGLVSYTKEMDHSLQTAGWEVGAKKIHDKFTVTIPLSHILGFAEDYKKVIMNGKHELILNRASTDVNCLDLAAVDANTRLGEKRSRVSDEELPLRAKDDASTSKKRKCDICETDVTSLHNHLKSAMHKQSLKCEMYDGDTEIVTSAFKSRIISYRLFSKDEYLTPEDFMESVRLRVINLIEENISRVKSAVKVNLELFGRYSKWIKVNDNDQEVEEVKSFNTKNKVISLDASKINKIYQSFMEEIRVKAEDFQERDSGWAISKVLHLEVNINKYQPLQGSSYIPLPKWVQARKACINVKNDDNACFAWAVVSALYPDDESGERSVCVLLAGEESEITFMDAPADQLVTDGCAHGYCVVYSTAERSSFAEAERSLQGLWAAGHTARRAVILVGNKADLARSRAVNTDEGKSLATSYECKFIETSVGINHNVDELLVGLLTQIRLKQQHAERVRKRSTTRKNRGRARSPQNDVTAPAPPQSVSAASTPRKRTRLSASVKVRGLLGRVWARDSKSKSCENLHVL